MVRTTSANSVRTTRELRASSVRELVRTTRELRANYALRANYERELTRELRGAPLWGTLSGGKSRARNPTQTTGGFGTSNDERSPLLDK